MSKKLFVGLIAISTGLLIAVIVMAWTNPTANPPGGSGAGFFPSGISIVFFQASCPSGWTQNTNTIYNDRVMMITSGAGGGYGGSWAISGLTNAGVVDHNHSTPSHAHNIATNGTIIEQSTGSGGVVIKRTGILQQPPYVAGSNTYNIAGDYTETSGGGTSGAGGSHNHTISQDALWRPSYLNAIICVKS